jgi:acyl carrier protein
MTNQRLFEVISKIMNVPVELVNEDSSPRNIEKWDSLSQMKLIFAVEEEFEIEFSDDEYVSLDNAAAFISAIQNKK